MDPAKPHRSARQVSLLVALITAVATPATVSLSYYRITGDPTFRPLAVTVERLVVGGVEVNTKTVRALVEGPSDAQGLAGAQRIGQGIQAAFYGKGVEAMVRIAAADHLTAPRVSFVVGDTRLGPYSEASAAQGVRTVVETLNLGRSAQSAARPHRW